MFSATTSVKIIESPKKLIGLINKANREAVYKSGGKLRTIMRRSIKVRKKKKSLPGNPPNVRQRGGFNLRMIVFKFNPKEPSMRVGPIVRGDDVPGQLEEGGRIMVKTKNGKVVQARVAPRPFAKPALETYKETYPEEWRNIIS